MSTQQEFKPEIGQTLWYVPRSRTTEVAREVTVIKVTDTWATVTAYGKGKLIRRDNMQAEHYGGTLVPGRCYLSKAAYDAVRNEITKRKISALLFMLQSLAIGLGCATPEMFELDKYRIYLRNKGQDVVANN